MSSLTALAATGTCAPCSDSPLSQTASIVGILTFANSLILGVLLFLSSTGRQILDSPAEVRELLAATEAQFDELRDGQAWLEAEVAAGRMIDGRKSLELRERKRSDGSKGRNSAGGEDGDISKSTSSLAVSTLDNIGSDSQECEAEKQKDYYSSDNEQPPRNALDASSPTQTFHFNVSDSINAGHTIATSATNTITAAATYAQATRLLDRAQLCFIASQRYLERYGRIVDDEAGKEGTHSGSGGSGGGGGSGGLLVQHVFRRASFVAAKQDVVRSTEVRAKALNDFRRFRNRVVERQAQRDRDMLHQQSLALQEVLRILKSREV